MEGTAATIGAWLLSSLLGGGVVGLIGWLALRTKLEEYFARVFVKRDRLIQELVEKGVFARRSEMEAVAQDLNNWGKRVNGLESVSTMALERADDVAGRLVRVEETSNAERQALSQTLKRIDRTLEEMDRRQRDDKSRVDRTVTLLDALEKRIDRHDDRRQA